MIRLAPLAIAVALLAGPGAGLASGEDNQEAIERENTRRAKAGLLPRKEPPRPATSGTLQPAVVPAAPEAARAEAGPAPSAAVPPPAARPAPAPPAAPPPNAVAVRPPPAHGTPREPGPLEAVVAAARSLSPVGAYGGPEVALDDALSGTLFGLSVRTAIRIRAGGVVLVVESAR